jgi:hypothetical protein
MSLDDYVHRRVNEKEKQPSELQLTIKENRLKFWIPAGIVAIAAAAGVLLSSNSTYDRTPSQDRRQPREIRHQAPEATVEHTPAIDFNLYRSPKNDWTGMKITIDSMMIDEWARYAPVKITIPELSYTAPFPVEQGAKSAETTFPSPVPSSGTYHYIIFGKDPATGNAKELYRHILAPSK